MGIRRYGYAQTWCKRICGLAVILLAARLLLPPLHTYASSWTELKGTLYTDDVAVPADGTSGVKVFLVLRDQDGHAVDLSPEQIRWHATLGTWAGTPTSEGNGTYAATLTATTIAGVSYVSAEAAGVTLTDLARVYFKPGAPSPERSVMTVSRQSLPADDSSQTVISLQLKDAHGNDIAEPSEGLQFFTSSGQLSSVTHVTYGHYEASLVSAIYGRLGTLKESAGSALQSETDWQEGAIPSETPNIEPLPISLSFSYESYGTYQAVLTAPSAEGTAAVTASLNGVTVTSNVYVTFSHSAVSIEPVSLSFGQASYVVNVGQQVSVGLSALWSDQSESSVTPFATYSVTDASIAAVDNGGIVHGLKAGQTVLTATYGGQSKDTSIVVTTPVVDPTPPPNRVIQGRPCRLYRRHLIRTSKLTL
ncbi:invasin domain 3-containing protein [Paenibacillus hexagrammi]|uniref:BIG2 domain-containing protein n=1 Tax=Paenibacillus hexagrammi TaxID=2908839 RepID=A0ABY3SFU7_9BACL|nr:invasin domain 3-containing protein [Paenibacillus sp. YPD9-1]UJF32644.1 hypothetical protein L0M14_23925 [Paenibacillus sp. YPD9-1]